MDPQISSGLLPFAGALVGALVAIYTHRRRRNEELADHIAERLERQQARKQQAFERRRDVFRLYADPLLAAVTSLKWRLHEVLEQPGRAIYLLAEAPSTPYHGYKFCSTLFRLAAVLGWIRAYRRQRAQLDPREKLELDLAEASIEKFESALADGPHVEDQRLEELIKLLVKGTQPELDEKERRRLSVLLENLWRGHIARLRVLSPSELDQVNQDALLNDVRLLLERELKVEVPAPLVESLRVEACLVMGIREAYLYRDWQSAIGDMMIVPFDSPGGRKFDVSGFRDFERLYKQAKANESHDDRSWILRLEALFTDLDMDKRGMFDARRDQLRKTYKALMELERHLGEKIEVLESNDT